MHIFSSPQEYPIYKYLLSTYYVIEMTQSNRVLNNILRL